MTVTDPELVRVLDYILNRCGGAEAEVIANALVRRRRDLALYGQMGLPNPQVWAKQAAQEASVAVGASLEGIRASVQEMIARLLRQEAPELSEDQIMALSQEWTGQAQLTEPRRKGRVRSGEPTGNGQTQPLESALPEELLLEMVKQFVAYSKGSLAASDEQALRTAMADWPERYWRAFPAVLQQLLSAYLTGKLAEADYRSQLAAIFNSD